MTATKTATWALNEPLEEKARDLNTVAEHLIKNLSKRLRLIKYPMKSWRMPRANVSVKQKRKSPDLPCYLATPRGVYTTQYRLTPAKAYKTASKRIKRGIFQTSCQNSQTNETLSGVMNIFLANLRHRPYRQTRQRNDQWQLRRKYALQTRHITGMNNVSLKPKQLWTCWAWTRPYLY